MSNSPQTFLIVDIGTSWSKAFLVVQGEPAIKATFKLPTSLEDLRFSTRFLIDKLKLISKSPKIVLTSALEEVSTLASVFGAEFITKEDAQKELLEWFSLQNFENPLTLDGGASNYLKNFRVADIGAYLSFRINETELENFIGNKTFRVHSVPENRNELEIEEAVLRASFSIYPDLHNPTKFNTIILTGGLLSWSAKPTRLALLILDLMSAGKVVQVLQDPSAFLNAFGALIKLDKSFKSKAFFLKNLGCLISLGGAGKVDLDWGLSEIQEITAAENEIALIPAASSQKLAITLVGEKGKKFRFQVGGGEAGVILDARLKPLHLKFGDPKTMQLVASWQQALEKVEVLEL